MTLQLGSRDWRIIAEETSHEMNSSKLEILVAELCHVLDSEDEQRSRRLGGTGMQKFCN